MTFFLNLLEYNKCVMLLGVEAKNPTVYIETTEVEKNVDSIRDKLVAQMEKLGAEKYQQKRDQELSNTLREIGLRTKPTGRATVIITKA